MIILHRICIVFLFISFIAIEGGLAQNSDSDSSEQSVYRPYSMRMRDNDSLRNEEIRDKGKLQEADNSDTITNNQNYLDSISAREQYVKDSIFAREQFVRDSILAREQFVRDSLLRRKQISDSVNILSKTLPWALKASVSLLTDDIILSMQPIQVVGDSILSDFTYTILPNRFVDPYTPWQKSINLSDNPVAFEHDTIAQIITKLTTPDINDLYTYRSGDRVIKVSRQGMFTKKQSGMMYKAPVDSVFFDAAGKVVKLKRYYAIYQATESYQLGALIMNHLWQVKQYTYSGNTLASFEIVKFCDRWKVTDPNKVCNISNYSIKKQGSYAYTVERRNNPENVYSDGTYRFEFDNLYNLKNVTFRNIKNTENWKTFIELNEQGNVSRYVYQQNGIVNRTLLVHYFDDPGAKHKVETITCTFEDDGISYFQRNNTTGKSRSRDRMTGEWSDWQ